MSCARDFEASRRLYIDAMATYDADAFRRVHHPEAVSVLPDGSMCRGVDAVMAAQAAHFERRVGVCAWKELHRFVDGCRVAYIAYETEYTVPTDLITVRLLWALTHVHEQGRWLVVASQATRLDP
jgi:SnoaL-like domain